jgi:four helix bundle protein
LPRGEGEIRDQLKRAATSIPLNIAESCGKMSGPDRARFLLVARGSALECGAILDVGRALGLVSDDSLSMGKSLLARIVAMLTKMTR